MKALARSYVWWPKLDEDLEGIVKTCQECQQNHKEDQKTPLHPLEQPTRPWQRVHLDFAGPFKGQMWLILVDAYSKWPEVIPMTTTTAPKTIQELRWIFARFGLPENIVTDNGPQFVATEFADFTRRNGIKHARVAPYHPRSNGQAERFVQTFKEAMKKMSEENGDIYQKLTNFLLIYRKTPHTTTTEAPALLLNKRNPRSRLDLIKPDVNRRIKEQQQKQKKYFDIGSQFKEFISNQPVWVRNYRGTNKWVPGTIIKQTGPVSYVVQVQQYIWKRHAEQLRARVEKASTTVAEDVPWELQTDPEPVCQEQVTPQPTCNTHLTYFNPGNPVLIQD